MEDKEKQELVDCIHNLMGCFDTPIARRCISNDIADEARQIGRDIMTKYGRATWVDPAGGIHSDDEEDPAAMYE